MAPDAMEAEPAPGRLRSHSLDNASINLPSDLITFSKDVPTSEYCDGDKYNAEKLIALLRKEVNAGVGSGDNVAQNPGVHPDFLIDQDSIRNCGIKTESSDGADIALTPPSDFSLVLPPLALQAQYAQIAPVNSYGNEYQLENIAEADSSFSFHAFAWAIQQKHSLERLEAYLNNFESTEFITAFNMATSQDRYAYPILFYAIERNDPELVRLVVRAGANVHQFGSDVPPLAFAIIGAANECVDPLEVIKALLAQGANPRTIRSDMWEIPLSKPKKVYSGLEKDRDPQGGWIHSNARHKLARMLNLSQRYFLNKADSFPRPKARKLQFGKIFAHISLGATRPLVLMFAGPSGHGKTELAMQIGSLLGAQTLRVDCTAMKWETDMFGCRTPYLVSESGSTLNNFLAEHNSERCIVVLDEFEKTTQEVRQALLLPLDSGKYDDRRTLKEINCSKAIWIFATNHGEDTILKFYNDKMKDQSVDIRAKLNMEELGGSLREDFIQGMSAPLTGRISEIIPFFPFSLVEQAVIAHGFIQKYGQHIRKPIDIGKKELVGHIHLDIEDDGRVCTVLAGKGYIPQLGARMLAQVVQNDVGLRLASAYQDSDMEVCEKMNLGSLERYTVKIESGRVLVVESGFTPFKGAVGVPKVVVEVPEDEEL